MIIKLKHWCREYLTSNIVASFAQIIFPSSFSLLSPSLSIPPLPSWQIHRYLHPSPMIYYVAHTDLKLLILLILSPKPKHVDYRHSPTYLFLLLVCFFAVLGTEFRIWCKLGKHSTNLSIPSASAYVFFIDFICPKKEWMLRKFLQFNLLHLRPVLTHYGPFFSLAKLTFPVCITEKTEPIAWC